VTGVLVCILKGKDGCDGIRLAVDYRYVNKFTVEDAYPLPDIQSIYQSVSKSNIISVTDCREGYWQLVRPPEYSFSTGSFKSDRCKW